MLGLRVASIAIPRLRGYVGVEWYGVACMSALIGSAALAFWFLAVVDHICFTSVVKAIPRQIDTEHVSPFILTPLLCEHAPAAFVFFQAAASPASSATAPSTETWRNVMRFAAFKRSCREKVALS